MTVIALIINILFFSPTPPPFNLNDGDLLIQDLDCGPFCDAVEAVTTGYQGENLSHIGMVVDTGSGELLVIEATSLGVVLTPIDTFLNKALDENGMPKVLVGRLIPTYKPIIPVASQEAQLLLGGAYDDAFVIGNDSLYCSELIYEAYKSANGGVPIFDLEPMTFIDPDTGVTFDIWTDYFADLGIPVPEGELGLNPGGISTSDKIEIVFDFKLENNR